jgi:rsbT co-antagonist protein RsbR
MIGHENVGVEPSIKVEQSTFNWDIKNGTFKFEETDSILFWITSAMKTFFDTIEEISGDEAASVVLETTGFRQGTVVSEFFNKLNLGIDDVVNALPGIYASAGWGRAAFKDISAEAKTAVITIKNSWEFKINKEQGKTKAGTFIPGHFAGILSGVFGESIWYRVIHSQLEGHDYCEFEFFPSDITVNQSIHKLARRKESLEIEKLEALVEERTKELAELIKDISSPIIPVLEGIVVVPLLGKYDEARSEELIEKTLYNLPRYQAAYLVLDLTGLHHANHYTVDFIHKLGTSASMLGTETILVGISPDLGMTISQSSFNLGKFNCFTTLQHGIYYALAQKGRKII